MWKNLFPGLFLCGSGVDFSGKSTQVLRMHNWIKAYLKNKKVEVILTKQPTNEYFGKRIRKILGDRNLFIETHPFDLQELFAKDSRMHCEKEVIPNLQKGNVVCTDRFRESMVYGQERGNIFDIHMLLELNRRYHDNYWVWPDRVFIFDLSPELAIERGKTSGRQFDEMERVDTLSRVRENFHVFAREYPEANLQFVDASRTVEEVFSDVRVEITQLLKTKGFELE